MSNGHYTVTDLAPALLGVCWTGFSLSLIAVFLRICVRLGMLKQRLFLHDIAMVLSLLANLVSCILLTLGTKWGLGRHQDLLNTHQIINMKRYTTFSEIFVVLAPMFGRISVALFILNVLETVYDRCRVVLWTLIAVQLIENAMIIIELFAQCHDHPNALWDPRVDYEKYCIPLTFETVLAFLSSALNSLSDLILVVLPTVIVLRLQMERRMKIQFISLFALSLLAFAISIVKAVQNSRLAAGDFSFSISYLQIYILVECNVIVISGSAPSLRPLWHRRKGRRNRTNAEPDERGPAQRAADGTQSQSTESKSEVTTDHTASDKTMSQTPSQGKDIWRTVNVDVSFDELSQEKQSEWYYERICPPGWQ